MSDTTDPSALKITYESPAALYASQIILSSNAEDLVLDFSSGVVTEAESGTRILPVHSRIALTRTGARRLHQLLGKALDSPDGKK